MRTISIAIDGFSKCGKSTLAKAISKEFGLLYIDSGALYRLAALWLHGRRDVRPEDLSFFDDVDMDFDGSVFYLGKDYTEEIGGDAVNSSVSSVAQNELVRQAVNAWIRNKAGRASVVMDGRDIGTVVLPTADLKLYLYASIEYRADCWRKRQLSLYGFVDSDLERKEIESIEKRDFDDLNRKIAPLKCAKDAVRFDVAQSSLEQIFAFACARIQKLFESDAATNDALTGDA